LEKIKFYVIDATAVARRNGHGGGSTRSCKPAFFALSGVLPREEAIAQIKKAIEKTYYKKGKAVIKQNFNAVDQTLGNLEHEVPAPPAGD
jgi:pyruvate-ferredoxin/flavodoxin oxidoreductase